MAAIEQLAEHFDTSNHGDHGVFQADDLDGLVDLNDTTLDTAGRDGAAASDREDVFDRHQEGLVHLANRFSDLIIDGVHEFADSFFAFRGALKSCGGGATDDLGILTVELVLGQKIADLFLDEFEQIGIVDEIDLIQENHELWYADLAGKQNVLLGLGHWAVSRGNHQNSAVHLGSTGDHVLDEVGMAGAIHMRVVALGGLVFDVRYGNRHRLGRITDGTALGDIRIGLRLGQALTGLHRQDRGGRSRLAMVNVADGADVDVGFGAFE